ncbi:MAG: PspC domain-containing protein [Jatrophihabitans sp.]|uniref:PspC domain-containing protein n=1 Tax=Jatrophihabitans sp. TaxID=1932789 RepID=UPI003F7FF0A2
MTTTDILGGVSAPQRVLRRSRTDRVGAGVAGGLGEYFGVDPVLFRVLFATSAFFGGAGILAYLIAWAAIPEAGTAHAPLDGWVRSLRARRGRARLVAVLAVLLLWAVAFSWWAPGPFFPVMIVVLVLVGVLTRRETAPTPPAVDLTKPTAPMPPTASSASSASFAATGTAPLPPVSSFDEAPDTGPGTPPGPTWMADTREWIADSRRAHQERRRRAQPVRLATVGALLTTLVVLGLIDAAKGIVLPTYFFVTLGIVGAGLLVGLLLRRTPWSLLPLLIPAVAGSIAYTGSGASLHDGFGDRAWTPSTSLAPSYRLAFGRGTLDLTSLTAPTTPTTVHITEASGQVRIVAPKSLDLRVDTHLHFGLLKVDGHKVDDGSHIDHVVAAPTGATGAPITIDVQLATGEIVVDHV